MSEVLIASASRISMIVLYCLITTVVAAVSPKLDSC